MRARKVFVLDVVPDSPGLPARASIVVTGVVPDRRGLLHVTPACMTLDELEAYIDVLRDELDILRAEARRTFVSSAGHA
jgi:hypothetical protein